VHSGLVLDLGGAAALDRASEDHGRAPTGLSRAPEGGVDLREVVTVDLDRLPAEGPGALGVDVEIPAVHRLRALSEPVDVDDRGQVVELLVRAVIEGLPDRALGHLAVAAEHPDPVREPVEPLAGERHPDPDRQPLPERPGGNVDPGQDRRRMALEPAAGPAEAEQLAVVDRPRRLQAGVEQRRGVAL
jgi:hypothetical protein